MYQLYSSSSGPYLVLILAAATARRGNANVDKVQRIKYKRRGNAKVAMGVADQYLLYDDTRRLTAEGVRPMEYYLNATFIYYLNTNTTFNVERCATDGKRTGR